MNELGERIPWTVLTEYRVFAATEPFGPFAQDLRFAVLCSIVCSALGVKMDPSELFPSLGDPVEQTSSDHFSILASMSKHGDRRNGQ